MNVFIANSTKQKIEQLLKLLQRIDKRINVVGECSSIYELEKILKKDSNTIDLIICEARLQLEESGLFSRINFRSIPTIISSTSKQDAYESLKSNCTDFILEPFEQEELSSAIKKVKSIQSNGITKRYKKRFIIKFGDKIQFRTVDEISYIYAEGKMAYIITKNPSRKYIIEYTLDELEKNLLDPSNFYRINRKFIVNIDSIEEARQYVNSRLKLMLNPPTDIDMVVSREKVQDFKSWLNL